MSIITTKEAIQFAKIEIDEDDTEEKAWVDTLVASSVAYLKNATGKEYPEEVEGVCQEYPLEKLYCGMLVNYWYNNREMLGTVEKGFNEATKALMIQLKN